MLLGDISATSSRNTVPSCAASKSPGLDRSAPVNAPRSWPNSSLSSRVSVTAAQLIGNKRFPGSRAVPVNGTSDEFLAGPGFARNQHCAVCGCDTRYEFPNRADRRTTSTNVVGPFQLADGSLKDGVLTKQGSAFRSPIYAGADNYPDQMAC